MNKEYVVDKGFFDKFIDEMEGKEKNKLLYEQVVELNSN